MGKFFLRFFLLLIITFVSLIIYLNYFGIKTDKFDGLIKNKVNEVNQYVKLQFRTTKIHLNLKELNLTVKLQNPRVLILSDEINLSRLDLFLPLKSFFSSDSVLERAEVAFVKNDIKDLTKITNIFLPGIINNQIKKIFAKGNLEGEFILPFNSDGTVSEKYTFYGKVLNADININKVYKIKNFNADIGFAKNSTWLNSASPLNGLGIRNISGFFSNLRFGDNEGKNFIDIQFKENKKSIKMSLTTYGNINSTEIKKISSMLGFKNNYFEDINLTLGDDNKLGGITTDIKFDIDNKFKFTNVSYEAKGYVKNIQLKIKEKKIINDFLPTFSEEIILRNTKITFSSAKENAKDNQFFQLKGEVKFDDEFEKINISQKYDKKSKIYIIETSSSLNGSPVNISRLNYRKEKGNKAEITLSIDFMLDKYFFIKKLSYSSGKNLIDLNNIKLNKNLEIDFFESLNVKTYEKNVKNNDFKAKKTDKVIISGEVFDAQPLLKSLYKKKNKKTFSKNFNSELKINFKKIITGTKDNVSNFAMIASIKKGSYVKLSSKGKFSENEIVEMSIYQIDKDKKMLEVISDRARPFIKNFDFIKGFEDGTLKYESIISKKGTNSNLTIEDFKVSKVPALAQLLTLASLQGIADTLSGEGIRFDIFEMKSNSEGNVLNIEDALAIGPAVSILLEGYVDKGKVVSLRGTLVPATKLNSFIASIPIVGDILVGKKAGEGVVGVSFKMKGPPKDIRTTVNPIKTITPRFIVRAVEKMKKKQKEETK